MGKIGRYIDALPDEARDRVIEAQAWCTDNAMGGSEQRCLVGHTEDWYDIDNYHSAPRDMIVANLPGGTEDNSWICVGDYFDRACTHFGLDRVVRACKLRAGRPNRVALPANRTTATGGV
jgi:hypothetical protein